MNAQVTGICLLIFPICFTSGLLIHETPPSTTRGTTSLTPAYSISSAAHSFPDASHHPHYAVSQPSPYNYGERLDGPSPHLSMEEPLHDTDAAAARIITRHRSKKPRRRPPPPRPKPHVKDNYDLRRYYERLNKSPIFKNGGPVVTTPSPPVMIYRGPDRPLEPYYQRPPSTKIQYKRRLYEPRSPNDLARRSSNHPHRLLRRSYSIENRNGDTRLSNDSLSTSLEEVPFPTGSESNATLQSSASTSFLNEYNSKSGVFADITRLKELQDDSDYQHALELDEDQSSTTALTGKPNYDIHSGGIFETDDKVDNATDSSETDSVKTGNGTESKLQHRSMYTRHRYDRYDLDYDYFAPDPAPVRQSSGRSNRHGRKRNLNSGRNSYREEGNYARDQPEGRRRSQDLDRYRENFRVMDHYDGGFTAPRARPDNRYRGGGVSAGRGKPAAPPAASHPPPRRPQHGEEYDFEDYELVPPRSKGRSVDSRRRSSSVGQPEVRRPRVNHQKIALNFDVRRNRRPKNTNTRNQNGGGDRLQNGVGDRIQNGGDRIQNGGDIIQNGGDRIQNGGGGRIQNGGDRIQNGGGDRIRNGGGGRNQNSYRAERNGGDNVDQNTRTVSNYVRSNEGGRGYSSSSDGSTRRSRPSPNRSNNPARQQRPAAPSSYSDGGQRSESYDYDYPSQNFRRSEQRRINNPNVSYDDID